MFSRTALLIISCFLLGFQIKAQQFSEIVAFGDSTSDYGNSLALPETIPYPSAYPMHPWVKQLAAMLKVPALKASGNKSFLGGTIYAYSGSTTKFISDMGWGWTAADKTLLTHNLTDQISTRYLGAFNTGGVKTGPEALHTIWIGLNDIVLAYNDRQQIKEKWKSIDEISAGVARSVEDQIQALATAGVKNVLWLNLPDPSMLPGIQSQKLAGGSGFKALAGASKAFNKEMDAAILRLKTANPSLNIIKLDIATRFQEIISNPSAFGFKNVTSGGFTDNHLFFFDGFHLTPHGNHAVAKFAFDTLKEMAGQERTNQLSQSAERK
ncbi:MAG: hypothetical protein A2X48_09385 [Lentisphaerae bacterium GWF2_49_21]|nr:MAG: hypothetical protein A2X48_09385 [Lentisphaerae bacterium GWF2_49_21]